MNKVLRILGRKGRVTIPFEIRQRVGFAYNDVLSFTEADDKRSVIVCREKICDGCKSADKKDMDEVTLLDFLNSLSDEEQRAALIHLSVRWAEKANGDGDGR